MENLSTNRIETDVLVIGGGLAGCWAALRARDFTPDVVLVDKGMVARSGTTVFCHEMLAPAPDAQLDSWLKEVVEHAQFMSEEPFARILLADQGKRVRDLESWGVPFERDERGDLFLALGRGHITSRVILTDCRILIEVMRRQLLARKVKLVERVMVTDLLTSDGQHPTSGRVVGAVGLEGRRGQLFVIKAKAVITTTGVISAKLHSSFADNLTGDGQAMVFRAGAELAGLEFMFGSKFVALHNGQMVVSSLMPLQTKGAHIVNRQGERFMAKYVPHLKEQRSTFGLLATASAKELIEGRGPIYFDTRHFSVEELARLRRVLPFRLNPLYNVGLDLKTDLVNTRPLVLYLDGRAIRINLHGETNLPGLLAGGIAVQFPGCGEYLSGATLAFCNVYGYRAGERAGELAREMARPAVDEEQVEGLKQNLYAPLKRKQAITPRILFNRLGKRLVRPEYSIVKTAAAIEEMLAEVSRITEEELPRVCARDVHTLIQAKEAKNFLLLMEPIYRAALERTESRLSHYRRDFPFQDDKDWLSWLLVKRDKKGVVIRREPVSVENNQNRPGRRERVPAAVQFGRDIC